MKNDDILRSIENSDRYIFYPFEKKFRRTMLWIIANELRAGPGKRTLQEKSSGRKPVESF